MQQAVDHASNEAVQMLAKRLPAGYGHHGIRVNSLSLG
jgi:NAD(P)-dependent dehydrogenase (short-subunit alcohol dehydrogenase family)